MQEPDRRMLGMGHDRPRGAPLAHDLAPGRLIRITSSASPMRFLLTGPYREASRSHR